MKISELPEPYKRMAEFNRVNESDLIICCFDWCVTRQGYDFWKRCHDAREVHELPEINK